MNQIICKISELFTLQRSCFSHDAKFKTKKSPQSVEEGGH